MCAFGEKSRSLFYVDRHGLIIQESYRKNVCYGVNYMETKLKCFRNFKFKIMCWFEKVCKKTNMNSVDLMFVARFAYLQMKVAQIKWDLMDHHTPQCKIMTPHTGRGASSEAEKSMYPKHISLLGC
jgi:hypothetical protein